MLVRKDHHLGQAEPGQGFAVVQEAVDQLGTAFQAQRRDPLAALVGQGRAFRYRVLGVDQQQVEVVILGGDLGEGLDQLQDALGRQQEAVAGHDAVAGQGLGLVRQRQRLGRRHHPVGEQHQVVGQAEVLEAIEVVAAVHQQATALAQRQAQLPQAAVIARPVEIGRGVEGDQGADTTPMHLVQEAGEGHQAEEAEVELDQQDVHRLPIEGLQQIVERILATLIPDPLDLLPFRIDQGDMAIGENLGGRQGAGDQLLAVAGDTAGAVPGGDGADPRLRLAGRQRADPGDGGLGAAGDLFPGVVPANQAVGPQQARAHQGLPASFAARGGEVDQQPRQVVGIWLSPQRAAQLHMGLGAGEAVIDEPAGLGRTEIRLAAIAGGDHGALVQHGLGQGQAESLAAAGRHQHIGPDVEGAYRRLGQVEIEQLDRRRRRMPCAPDRQLGGDVVMGIGKGFDDQHHVVRRREGAGIGVEQDVDALARKAGRDVQQLQSRGTAGQPAAEQRRLRRDAQDMIGAQANGHHGHVDAIVFQHPGHIGRHAGDQLEIAIEAGHGLHRQQGLLPAIAGQHPDLARHVAYPWRIEQAQHGGCRLLGAGVGGRADRVSGEKLGGHGNGTGTLGRPQRHAGANGGEAPGQFAVDHRQAVAAVERTFQPHLDPRVSGLRQPDPVRQQLIRQPGVKALRRPATRLSFGPALHPVAQRRIVHQALQDIRRVRGRGGRQRPIAVAEDFAPCPALGIAHQRNAQRQQAQQPGRIRHGLQAERQVHRGQRLLGAQHGQFHPLHGGHASQKLGARRRLLIAVDAQPPGGTGQLRQLQQSADRFRVLQLQCVHEHGEGTWPVQVCRRRHRWQLPLQLLDPADRHGDISGIEGFQHARLATQDAPNGGLTGDHLGKAGGLHLGTRQHQDPPLALRQATRLGGLQLAVHQQQFVRTGARIVSERTQVGRPLRRRLVGIDVRRQTGPASDVTQAEQIGPAIGSGQGPQDPLVKGGEGLGHAVSALKADTA